LACSGDPTETQPCNTQFCPIDCVWGEWEEWGPCSATCGPTTQTATRVISVPAEWGGEECTDENSKTQDCVDSPACPVDCVWDDWSLWSECSEECDGGEQERTREQVPAQNGGASCPDSASEKRDCNTDACPGDCVWDEWTRWTPCSVTCGVGTQSTLRYVLTPAVGAGKPCSGSASATQSCKEKPCPEGCEWTEWSKWSACSVIGTCGGNQTRTRGMSPEEKCEDVGTDIRACDLCGSIDAEAEEEGGGCGGGCIAGIVVGVLAGIVLVVTGVYFACTSGAGPTSKGFEMV